jgi:hypothetical protein
MATTSFHSKILAQQVRVVVTLLLVAVLVVEVVDLAIVEALEAHQY